MSGRVVEILAAAVRAVPLIARLRDASPDAQHPSKGGGELRAIVESLGPVFLKLGQTLSTRPDVVGGVLASELGALQDAAQPFDSRLAFAIIEAELGIPATEAFAHIGAAPVAAASFGQVYRARLRGASSRGRGRDVAVKVQRPRVRERVALDVYILRVALRWIKLAAGMSRDLPQIADEIGAGLFGELDYVREAENARRFARANRGLDYVRVPKPFAELTTPRVLTMDWVEGKSTAALVAEMEAAAAGGPGVAGVAGGEAAAMANAARLRGDLVDAVKLGVRCTMHQLLDSGIMHADPHPGNILVTRDGKVRVSRHLRANRTPDAILPESFLRIPSLPLDMRTHLSVFAFRSLRMCLIRTDPTGYLIPPSL